MSEATITIEGAIGQGRSFTRETLAALPLEGRISDVSIIEPRRQGEAVRLSCLLDDAQPDDAATHVTLHSADGFSASIPITEVRESGLIIYQLDGQELPDAAGGPFRFLIPNAAECRTAELDACANVKSLARIELTAGKGTDTRYG
jgi:2-dehydropantoate 2-reductase